jgi:peptidoglycan DL-endopeptidase CwlO
MHMNRGRLAAALILTLLMSLAVCAPALGDPVAVKEAEAAHIQSQISALDTKAEIASEQYNAARIHYNKITSRVHATERQIKKIQKHMHALQSQLDTRVNDMYRQGPLGFLPVILSARSYEDFDTTIRVLTSLNAKDAATVAQLKASKAAAQRARATLVSEQQAAKKQKSAMAKHASQVKAQLASRKRLLASVTAEIQGLIAQRLASQDVGVQSRTMALLLRHRSPSSGGICFGGAQPASQKASTAVYWAEKQLGKPYVWAAAGPSTFDCSGLVMYAYAHAGVNLNHYSGDQINEGKRIPKSRLKPGDLVFFGSPIHHVGMYVGGGNFIEAPYSGTDVRISRLSSRGDFAGACRPG